MRLRSQNAPTFIEVCAGAGGLSAGFLSEGFDCMLLNDNDAICCQTLRANHVGVPVVQLPMQALDLRPYRGQCDVLVGGVPCQSFSYAGRRRGLNDERGNLMFAFANLIDQVRPKMFVVENVKGLTTHEHGNTLRRIVDCLAIDDNYAMQWTVLDAQMFNVPQRRQRLFLVGVRRDANLEFEFPNAGVPALPQPTLRAALRDVPVSTGYTYSEQRAATLALVPEGGHWVDLPVDVQRAYMGRALGNGGGNCGYARRLKWDDVAPTLTTSPCQKSTDMCHPSETRPLTVRECARIQTFPDTYRFFGSIAQQYKQIGNAVPVNLARAMAAACKQCLV